MAKKIKPILIATIFAIQVLMFGMTVSMVRAQGTNWAILISGGVSLGYNHARYWNDLGEMNKILIEYGYNPTDIFVLYADGSRPTAANCSDWLNIDGNYSIDIIDGSATRANLQAVCNHISTNGDPDDTLFVFSTDHGGSDAAGIMLNLWGESIYANDFAGPTYLGAITQYRWRAFEMEQCFSGGFIGPLSGPRTVIATACASTELSYAMWPPPPYYDEFCYYFNAALRGKEPNNVVVNADYDGDGRVSFMEAFNYAESHDTAPETPQYDDNADGISNSGQMPLIGDGCLGSMVFLGDTHTAIDHGLVWLCNDQNLNGSWSNSVGMTSLGALVFLNSGISEGHFAVQDAIGYITGYVLGDGSISNGSYRTYDTSLATMALVATHNPDYTGTIDNAADWLRASQWDESCLWGSVSMDNWHYGGFGYGYHIRPDLSNTQFALMALDSVTSISKYDPLWDKAQVFLARDQMRQQDVYIPDLEYTVTWNPSYNIYDDGGFVYYPGMSLSLTGTSYGSMTAAGIWSLRLCDVPSDDPRTIEALDWLLSNYTWDYNPGMTPDGRRFQYYYYLALSKALTMTLSTEFFNGHDWYADMSDKLLTLQYPDGHWVNTYTGHGGEGDPALCTAYSVLSLQVREIPVPISRLSWWTFILHSSADLHVYDPLGRHVGMNYQTGEVEIEIPGASFEYDNGGLFIELPYGMIAGKYIVQMVGTETGEYELIITGGTGGDVLINETINGFILEGAVHEVVATSAMVVGLTLDVDIYDEDPPETEIEVPQPSQALQDGVTLTAAVSDQSGVDSVSFYVREPGGTDGIPIGYEDMPAIFNETTSRWELDFDTTQLLDGHYVILARAVDSKGHEGWSEVVPFSIRNWAIVELLPASETNKAGRTMPVKFSLRIAEAVDPDTPFVYNENLEIRIYDAAEPGNILQTSTFGPTSTDYRINSVTEIYITNFRSKKEPGDYVVEIWRTAKNFMIGRFTFQTLM